MYENEPLTFEFDVVVGIRIGLAGTNSDVGAGCRCELAESEENSTLGLEVTVAVVCKPLFDIDGEVGKFDCLLGSGGIGESGILDMNKLSIQILETVMVLLT